MAPKLVLSDLILSDRPIDPNGFEDRCASAVNLLRALAIAVNPEMHGYDFRLDEWDVHHACIGVAELLEALQVDLGNYFGARADKKKRKSRKPAAAIQNPTQPFDNARRSSD